MNRRVLTLLAVAGFAVLTNGVVGWKLGLGSEVVSDAHYYQQLAQSVAAGEGYRVKDSFWPDVPSMRRMPGWPLLVAGIYSLGGSASPDVSMRLLCLLLNVGVAVLVALLALRLFRHCGVALISGGLYAVHPGGLMPAGGCLSEPLFLVLCLGGFLVLISSRLWRWLVGAFLMGLAVLTRANFLLWGFAFCGFLLIRSLFSRTFSLRATALVGVGLLLFLAPVSIWVARNYRVSGKFPVVSTVRGQTFYGGNNEVVANNLSQWGYWVFPDRIPGETPMRELASTMSEYEVDAYYYAKGQAYVQKHLCAMPRLWLGKLLRGYGPIPWNPSLGGYAQGLFRGSLFILALIGCVLARTRVFSFPSLGVMSLVAVNVLTMLVFWGSPRFSLAIEPFLIPFAVFALLKGCMGTRRTKAEVATDVGRGRSEG
jgi:hypothetical protein